MIWMVVILLLLFLILFAIVIMKMTIVLKYNHDKDDDHLMLEIRTFFGLIRYKKDIPLIKLDDNSPTIIVKDKVMKGMDENISNEDTKQISSSDIVTTLNDMKEILTHVFDLHRIIRKFLRKVSIKKLEWQSVIGLGDAAHTAMIVGVCWAIKGSVIGLLSNYMRLKVLPTISITPQFQRMISQTSLICMIQFRIGNAILAGIKLVKFWKGGKAHFKSKRLSLLSDEKKQSI